MKSSDVAEAVKARRDLAARARRLAKEVGGDHKRRLEAYAEELERESELEQKAS
jgi:hypothetical protein